MLRKICLLPLFFFCLYQSYSQRVDFYREDLKFTLKPVAFYVDGLYYFNNPGNRQVHMRMSYPFPKDEAFGEVDSVFCHPAGNPEIDRILKTENEQTVFELIIPPKDTSVYRIGYKQSINGNKARYILTTTSSWGKAFDTANYHLLVKGLEVDSLSYIPDRVKIDDKGVEFLWHKKNFMPARDMIIYFH